MYKLVHYIYPTTFGYVGYTYYSKDNIIYYRLNKFRQVVEIISEKIWALYFDQRPSLVRRINKICVVKPITRHLKFIYREIDNSTLQKVN